MRRDLALLLALTLLLPCAGCTEEAAGTLDDTGPSASTETAPVMEAAPAPQIFSLAYDPSTGFNPYTCTEQIDRTVLSLLYEPLFTVDSSFHAVPYLCEHYEASGDGRTHTLRLRPGVTFSDGTPLTSKDVVASLHAAMGSPFYGDRLRHVSEISAGSDLELTITTDAAVGALDALLSIYIVSAATVDDDIPLGSGPFEPEGDGLRRSNWWRGIEPVIEQEAVRFVATQTPSAVRDSFEYGIADLVCTDPNAGVQVSYHSDYELWDNTTTVMQYLGFNFNSAVFGRREIRCAVSYGIDRESIVSNSAQGFATAAVLPASPYADCYDRTLAEAHGYNEAAFQDCLNALQVSDPKGNGVLAFDTQYGAQPLRGTMLVCQESSQRAEAAQAIADMLNERGFDLQVQALDREDYLKALERGDYDLFYGEVRLSPDFDLTGFFTEGSGLCYGSNGNIEAAQLCAHAVENEGNAYALHEMIVDRGLLCPVLFKLNAIYSNRGRVTGLTPCLDGVFLQPFEETR